jgi:Arc/MetJ-type ribon-helix-helix transcriptional regulator
MEREFVLVRLSLSSTDVEWLDRLVVEGGYRSRADALQSIVHTVAEDDRACEPQQMTRAA